MKYLLVVDVIDDVIEEYKDLSINYVLNGIRKDNETIESISYPENVPLIPLLKGHGRLIDADETIKVAWQSFYAYEDEQEKKDPDYIPFHRMLNQDGFEVCLKTIVEAPTIIEGETE